ncbi:hypothetical protein AJ80_00317 [Polytolypa hystricis UAMH7299]|uniref:Mitochondrial outer membrane transport complex Sam37/metaxin N-terminal domain-containing protein n=1 Tax=Polytolypa hystricis (strain UAMH7299) TaxID=1447883 RepID=A0A2B7Z3X5_POLH7|nr:hypothetical protein AJ80_00317 [Polytolypa hystricis UAMH7299]
MVLELHVWGPAFGLPSIDPQCLATIAYFALAVPAKRAGSGGDGGREEEWVLVADSDPGKVPTNELPALWTGTRWISRFRNIVQYLCQYSGNEWNLDRWMGKRERADCIAFSSFLESHGQPLVDLSLYVSSENYNSATAPAFASLLQWPNQWIIPPQLRDAAKKRTDYLGLSSLDLDAMEEEERQKSRDPTSAVGQIPKSLLRRPPPTVSGLLGKTAQQNRIRLEGTTAAFVAPLEELLGRKGFLLADEIPSSLDCLALGYLSLAVVPELKYSWLRDAIQSQSARLATYVDRLRKRCFGAERVDVGMAFCENEQQQRQQSSLPWRVPERMSAGSMGLRVLEGVADSLPIVKELRASQRLQRRGEETAAGEEQELVAAVAKAQRREVYTSIVTVLAGIGLFVSYLLHSGVVTIGVPVEQEEDENEQQTEEEREEESPSERQSQTQSHLGAAGAILGI